MSSIDDKLNEVLNITPEIIESSEISTTEETQITVPIDKDAEVDFDTGRENLYKMLEKGNNAIDGILALAKEIEAAGKTPEDAFNLILKEFWKTNVNNQNWKVNFENVFGLSLETFYSNLSDYSNDISLYYPPSEITLQNILRN